MVTTVHVLFDESIPERSADYFLELDEAAVKCHPEDGSVTRLACGSTPHRRRSCL